MALTRAARAAAAAAAAHSSPICESTKSTNTQEGSAANPKRQSRGRNSARINRRISSERTRIPRATIPTLGGSSSTDEKMADDISRENSKNSGNEATDRCSDSRTNRSNSTDNKNSNTSDADKSGDSSKSTGGINSNVSSSNSSKGMSPIAAAVPRVTLFLLGHRRRTPGTDPFKPSEKSEQKPAIPGVFSRLSLGLQAPEPAFQPIKVTPGRFPSEAPVRERGFLNTTAAPGVVTLRPLEPRASPVPHCSSTASSGPAALGWQETSPPIRDGSAVLARVATGEGPPKATDGALQQGVRRCHTLPSPELDELKKEERRRKKEGEKHKLSKWFGLPLTEISPQLLRELRVLQLRGHANSKTFGAKNKGSIVSIEKEKGKDGGTPICRAYLQVGRLVDGGLRGVGGGKESQAAGASNKGPGRRGGSSSLLHSMLSDPEVHRWTKRKYREIQLKNNNGHSAGWTGHSKKKKRKN